jgi:hypothetical protein
LVSVGVPLQGQLAVGRLNLLLAGPARHPQLPVPILVGLTPVVLLPLPVILLLPLPLLLMMLLLALTLLLLLLLLLSPSLGFFLL